MTDDELELSRRTVLATLGTIGAVSAGAGVGTSAFFGDGESFDDNSLTAGTLDLTVGWSEHYSDWSADEAAFADASDGAPAVEDQRGFLNATRQEAFPDEATRRAIREGTADPCAALADVPTGLDGGGQPRPLIDVDDVKPGDSGFVSFDLALCDNPGYLWLNGAVRTAAENGTSEPETDDPDEGDGVELLDAIRASVWYDADGDALYDPPPTEGEAEIVLVIDRSASMTGGKLERAKCNAIRLVGSISDDVDDLGLVTYGAGALDVRSYTFDGTDPDGGELTESQISVAKTIAELSVQADGAGDGVLSRAIEEATTTLTGADAADPTATKAVVVLGDGLVEGGPALTGAVDDAAAAGIDLFTIAVGDDADTRLLQSVASAPEHAFVQPVDPAALYAAIPAATFEGEQLVTDQPLRDVLRRLSIGDGLPLDGDRETPFDEEAGAGDDPFRECFTPAPTRHRVGFAWYLPVDHANEVQTDSASFDLGFYAEQCRHNDGSGAADVELPAEQSMSPLPSAPFFTAFSTFRVSELLLPDGGFVALHADDGGSPGDVLAHTFYLAPGLYVDTDFFVTSSVFTDPGLSFIALPGITTSRDVVAVAHADDGDFLYEFVPAVGVTADPPYRARGEAVADAGRVVIDD
jgi:hypothetical protein